MVLSLTLPTNGTAADVSTVNIPFGQVQTGYNNHVGGTADQHDTTQVTDGTLSELTGPTNGSVTTHARLDMIFVMLSAIMGGSGTATTRYGALPSNITSLNATINGATNVAGASTIVKRDTKGGAQFGMTGIASTIISAVAGDTTTSAITARGFTGGLAPFIVQNPAGTATVAQVDNAGSFLFVGQLFAGSSTTLVTDAAGKVLSAALNTVGVLQGGTGSTTAAGARTNLGAAASGANADITALSALTTAITAAQGGSGRTTLTANNLLVGNGTAAVNFIAPGVANNFLVDNGTAWVSAPFSVSLIPSGALTLPLFASGRASATTPTANTVVNIASTQFYRGDGVFVQANATTWNYDGSAGHIVPPTGQERWDLLYYENVTGTLVTASNGNATAGSATKVSVPTNAAFVIAYVFLRATTTQILNADDSTSGHGYILDARPNLGFYGNGNGGTGGTSTSATVATIGAPATAGAVNGVRLDSILLGTAVGTVNSFDTSTYRVAPTIVKFGATESPISDALNFYIQPDLPSRLTQTGSGTATAAVIQAGTGGSSTTTSTFTIVAYGPSGTRVRSATATVTSNTINTSGNTASGARYLIADLNGASGFTLVISTSPVTSSYQVLLATLYYDATGGNFQMRYTVYKTGSVLSNNVQQIAIIAQSSGVDSVINNTVHAVPTNMQQTTFYLPEGANMLVMQRVHCYHNVSATGDYFYVSACFDASPVANNRVAQMAVQPPAIALSSGSVTSYTHHENLFSYEWVVPGQVSGGASHVLSQSIFRGGNQTTDFYEREVIALIYGVW